MAPPEAKVFHKILTDTIANFEKAIGPIVVPSGMMPEGTVPDESK